VLVLLAFAVTAAFTSLPRLIVPYTLLVILLAATRVPLRLIVERVSELLPFVLLAAAGSLLAGDPSRFGLVLGRALVTVIGLVLLTATTPLPDLLQAARRLGLPLPLVSMIGLALRYLVVLMDEGNRMGLAFSARAVGPRDLRLAKPLGRLVGALAFRSLERSERIHRAMLARGYTGELPSVATEDRLTAAQVLVSAGIVGLLACGAWCPA
jgi:cobalt/nickel transport system permease protein